MKALVLGLGLLGLAPACLGVISFPGAEGFGAEATGGRGGTVYHVTNLNNSGAGSFRDAVSSGNRTVVFDVGGVVTITSPVIVASNVTVAGQTAPGGVAIFGDELSLSNKNNIVIRYLTVRQGIDSNDDDKAINITNGSNMILDHVSIAWGRWDNLGITSNSHDITVQNSIIAEGIDPQRFGSIIDSSRNLSILRNLWINNQGRNPKGKGDLQYINNVVYNYRSYGYAGGHSSAPWHEDLINNYFIAGRSTEGDYITDFNANDVIYNSNNWIDDDETDADGDGLPNGRKITDSGFQSRGASTVSSAYNVPDVPATVLSPAEAFKSVKQYAGNSLKRDGVDLRLIDQLSSLGSKGAIIATEATVGGQPAIIGGVGPVDSDQDGMPDAWELANGLNPNLAGDRNLIDPSGWTELEVYLNSIVPEPVTTFGFGILPLLIRRRHHRSIQIGVNTIVLRLHPCSSVDNSCV